MPLLGMVNINENMARIRLSLEAYVHEDARGDELTRTRHHAFIVSHLFSGILALCAFPLYLAIVGKPDLMESLAFMWLLAPIGVAAYLSRTGRLETAHLISAANLAALVVFVAAITGGIGSFVIAWLIVIPVEASLSASRRTVLLALMLACLALLGLFIAGDTGMLPPARQFDISSLTLLSIGIMSAIIYVGGIAMNVEKLHRQSARAIREGEARYRLLAQNATDMISRHSHNGHAMFVSDAAKTLLGCHPGQLTGDGIFERVHILDRPAFLTSISSAYVSGEPVSLEYRLRRDNSANGAGEYIWVEMRCRMDENGDIVAVTRDVSERKAQEAQLLEARDNAEKANVAKSQFLANISHELRTPLNAIIGFSELMNNELCGKFENEQHREYSGLIHQSGEHLLHLVNDLLDMSKLDAEKYQLSCEDFDLGGLIKSTCKIIKPKADEQQLNLVQESGDSGIIIHADKRGCRQIILNLLSNAVKFSKPGGTVSINASRQSGGVAISIADQGIGIDASDLKRLGQPFVQANGAYDRHYEGTGLGLSIVKGLLHLHDGEMQIESTPDTGTRVTVFFPQDAQIEPLHAPKDENTAVSSLSARRSA